MQTPSNAPSPAEGIQEKRCITRALSTRVCRTLLHALHLWHTELFNAASSITAQDAASAPPSSSPVPTRARAALLSFFSSRTPGGLAGCSAACSARNLLLPSVYLLQGRGSALPPNLAAPAHRCQVLPHQWNGLQQQVPCVDQHAGNMAPGWRQQQVEVEAAPT